MSDRNYRIDSGGTPICYIWPLPKHNFMADLATTETIGKDGMEEAEICCDDQTTDGTKMETVTANAGGKGQEIEGRVEGEGEDEEEEGGKKTNTNTKDGEEENIPMGMTKVPEKTMRVPNTGSTTGTKWHGNASKAQAKHRHFVQPNCLPHRLTGKGNLRVSRL